MRTPQGKTIRLLALSSILLIAVPAIGIVTMRHQPTTQQQETRQLIDSLPPVISKVLDLEVVSAKIEKTGQPDAVAAIEIRNKSDRAVLAVAIESGDKMNFSGLHLQGETDAGKPVIIIEPQGTATFRWQLNEIMVNSPLRVAGAFYADGTEEGEEETLKTMRGQREHERSVRAAQKGGSKP